MNNHIICELRNNSRLIFFFIYLVVMSFYVVQGQLQFVDCIILTTGYIFFAMIYSDVKYM